MDVKGGFERSILETALELHWWYHHYKNSYSIKEIDHELSSIWKEEDYWKFRHNLYRLESKNLIKIISGDCTIISSNIPISSDSAGGARKTSIDN